MCTTARGESETRELDDHPRPCDLREMPEADLQEMNPHDIKRLFPNASAGVIAANSHPDHSRPAAQPQPACRKGQHGGLGEAPIPKKAGSERLHLRIISVRKRLLDPDNIVPKWTIDALRYCGIIQGDEPDKITLETGQRKIRKGEEEHTVVEIFELNPTNP